MFLFLQGGSIMAQLRRPRESKLYLREFFLEGDWEPLFQRLEGWKGAEWYTDCDYTDLDACVTDKQREQYFCLEARSLAALEGSRGLGWFHRDVSIISDTTIPSPSGLIIPIHHREINNDDNIDRKYIMNHAAIAVSDLEKEIEFWNRLLQVYPTMIVRDERDPILDKAISSAHYYITPNFYITLRDEGCSGKMHHCGFEARDRRTLSEAKRILQEICWPILWEGRIDQSYVLHFQAPDGRIHDFSYTSPTLKKMSINQLNEEYI